MMAKDARDVFGARAAFYTTSEAHTDEAVLSRVVELARPQPADVALDVGTGTGHTAIALATRVARVTGTDVTPEMLAEARALAGRRGVGNVTFEIADVEALPYVDGSFDIVTCRRALHHFLRPEAALAEMRRVMRPGGRLVIDDRSVPDDADVDEVMNRLDILHDGSHVREYRPRELADMVAAAGFDVTDVETYTQHRPLTSLTATAEPEDAAEIGREVAGYDASLRAKMRIEPGEDGELMIIHWFVLLAATTR